MIERRKTVSFEEAQELLLRRIKQVDSEKIALEFASGRVLAKPIFAPYSYPNFRRAGYDGYAICEEDDGNYPITLKVVAEVPCGETYDLFLKKGETVRIMTGAKVPENTSKIIMLEQSREQEEGTITLINTQKNSNITEVGAEFEKGDLLLDRFEVLNAGALSLCAAFGITELEVYQKPRVAIFSTGSELVTPGAPLPDGKIYNSNQVLLETLVVEHGGIVTYQEQLPDDYALTLRRLEKVAKEVDMIITTGGVSVGDFDFMAKIAKEEADELLFNKVRMRPGSPTTAILFKEKPVIALSGNPGACFIGFYLFVEKALKSFVGKNSSLLKVKMIMASDYLKNNGFDRFLRATYKQVDGIYQVKPVGSDASSSLGNLQKATCLVKIPYGKVGKTRGEDVDAWLLLSK
ncbi:molybdopterin molybdotransferase MoeA [Listeria sp. PSOL-1]|uniref:molybdopterin molybdotransferase MoeA n=1 Tax=Listeria sp. PSOL-1 TaxID=1844999 RepID=UPI0013D09D06|nr:molybdopterin molybdotransferase MoeA [Listeria sp. PSOL-1]